MPRDTHSVKTLETLRLMGLTTKGWRYPDIEWVKVMMTVPTVKQCKNCYGRGRLWGEGHGPNGEKCPTCGKGRGYKGSGEVLVMEEREVEVGYIKWPEGTKFNATRYSHGASDQCQLCGKSRIVHWVPVLNDTVSPPVAMYVGADCGRTILGVAAMKDTTFEIDAANATRHSAQMKAWREIPKPPKVKKPEKPKLPADMPAKATIDSILLHYFGSVLSITSLSSSRAEWEFSFILTNLNTREWFRIKYSARHGVTVSADIRTKPFVKVKGVELSPDTLDASLAEAIPMIQEYMGLPVTHEYQGGKLVARKL